MTRMLSDILDDETYDILISNHLLDPVKIRDYFIKRTFRTLRNEGVPVREIIRIIHKDLPYMHDEYLKQIFYRKKSCKK